MQRETTAGQPGASQAVEEHNGMTVFVVVSCDCVIGVYGTMYSANEIGLQAAMDRFGVAGQVEEFEVYSSQDERERCAEIADQFERDEIDYSARLCAANIATEIRKDISQVSSVPERTCKPGE